MEHPNLELLALGVRQPWAELIVRGVKTIEVRSQPLAIRRQIYIYASRTYSDLPAAAEAADRYELDGDNLPRGMVVGTVELDGSHPSQPEDAAAACVPPEVLAGQHSWRLHNASQLEIPLEILYRPCGIWFYPFQRKK